jgi:hypothetical protein
MFSKNATRVAVILEWLKTSLPSMQLLLHSMPEAKQHHTELNAVRNTEKCYFISSLKPLAI